MRCPDCNGTGEIYFEYGDDPDDAGYEPCPTCKGKAVVKVKSQRVDEDEEIYERD